MYSISDAVTKFKEILQDKPNWKDLVTSQFAEHLSVFVSWCLRAAQWFVERAKQEFFISTALNRSSIIAHAENREYLPVKPQAATGEINIVNDGTYAFTLPTGTEFTADDGTVLTTTDAVTLDPSESGVVPVDQKEYAEYTETVATEKSFLEILISQDDTPLIASLEVYVDDELWEYSKLLQNAYDDSQMYDEFYSASDQIGIRFGDGTFGLIPPEGAEIVVKAWKTKGDIYLASGQQVFLVGEALDANNDPVSLIATISTPIQGGRSGEDIESIRRSLHYWPIFNDQLVWDDDYVFFVKRRFPDITWINVWGEKEAEVQNGALDLAFINTIFVSAYESGGADISASVIAALTEKALKTNRRFQWVAPAPVTYTVNVVGQVEKSRNITDITNAITTLLTDNYGPDSKTRKSPVLLKEMYSLIDKLGYFDKDKEYYEVVLTGNTSPSLLEEFVALDIAGSTIDISYLQ